MRLGAPARVSSCKICVTTEVGHAIAKGSNPVMVLRAERFYTSDQRVPDGTRRTQAVWGVAVDEIRYRRALWLGFQCLVSAMNAM